MSPRVVAIDAVDPLTACVANSSTLGRRRRPVSGNCSVLDRGVGPLEDGGLDPERLCEERPVADFHDFKIDFLTLKPFSGGC